MIILLFFGAEEAAFTHKINTLTNFRDRENYVVHAKK
jgi:hypothetical protein